MSTKKKKSQSDIDQIENSAQFLIDIMEKPSKFTEHLVAAMGWIIDLQEQDEFFAGTMPHFLLENIVNNIVIPWSDCCEKNEDPLPVIKEGLIEIYESWIDESPTEYYKRIIEVCQANAYDLSLGSILDEDKTKRELFIKVLMLFGEGFEYHHRTVNKAA